MQAARSRSNTMVTVKSSQKIFTDSEVASLTGICMDHLHNFAKSRHLGFIARAAEAADRKSTRLNSSHIPLSRMPPSASKNIRNTHDLPSSPRQKKTGHYGRVARGS